jgi:hypothetical protein
MNITELDSYRLTDAVKFHNRLNPALWGRDEHLLPDVRSKLAEIAADFQEFLGIADLDVEDITISGSNAAFSYTPHSDIDLHLVIRKPEGSSEVYQELFNAKKYQYNDMHDIRIRGADVELYVQDADATPVSLGQYSIKNGAWIQVPKKKRAKIDQSVVQHKYQDLGARIDSALKSNDVDHIAALIAKIKTMRQTGLDQHGEFGPENLAFKILRKQGYIQKLHDAQAAARDRELSLQEKNKPKQTVRYGFGEGDTGMAQGSSIGDAGAQSTWDGVSPDTDEFLSETQDQETVVQDFIQDTAHRLGIERMPQIELHSDSDWSKNELSFGMYQPESHVLHVNLANRHLMDILRTTAHELAHCRQHEISPLPDHAGETGSQWENQAHATAGVIMRDYAEAHPDLFESSGYIPTQTQAQDPRFKMALTVDVKPGQTGREANKLNLHTDSQGRPALLIKNLKNALREFKETGQLAEQDLFEINMSPTNLKKLAAQTGALAGMEFEMIVPGIEGGEDADLEPDYDQDERVASIEDAVDFFNGDYNGPRELRRLRESMSEDYQTWLGDAWMEHFETYKTTIVFRYGKENWSEADIVEIMGMDEAAAEALATRGATPEDYMDAAEKVIADGLDPWLNDAQEDAQQEYYDEDHEDDWLASEGLRTMSDVENQYEISWPYWSSGSNEGAGIESVADEFREAIGRKVNWSASYHGGKREDNAYVVEPDGSLIPSDSDDAGLEFISPKLPINDMISDLNKVKAWADQRGCYTSKAAKTGLHINVSVPGHNNNKLDYVKLALLLGDEYVLNQFERLGNSYAASAMGIIKERIAQRPEDAAAMLQKMKTGLAELATKVIHSGTTSKFTSINTKSTPDGDYIEFRSPGGDWLNTKFDKIETTLLRFVVALDAAMDPAKYRDEYLKKLYTVLKPKDQNDTLSYFAKFAAGELPKAALKSFIRQAQLERKGIKTPPGDSTYTAIPSSGNQKYEIQRIANDEIVGTFNAASDTDASAVARQWLADNGLHRVNFRFNRATGQERAEQRTGASNYKIYQISDGRTVGTFYAADQAQADAEFTDWLMSPAAGGRDDFRYAPIDTPIQGPAATTPVPGVIDIEPDVEQNFVPGSTLDLQRQRQYAGAVTGGNWDGQWKVVDSNTGDELYRFGGIGNSQADANRIAGQWVRSNNISVPIEVYPVMEP